MPLRPATYRDIDTVSAIFAAGFHDEELMGGLMHPYRLQYPQDYLTYWRRKCNERWWDYHHVWMVSYYVAKGNGDGVKGQEVITGVADWERQGKGWMRLWGIKGWWDPRLLIKPIVSMYYRFLNLITTNRAADPLAANLDASIYPYVVHHWAEPRSTNWTLDRLSVHPNHQGQGHGRELVKWGLDRADEEGLPAGVIAAQGKERFYQRCGFETLVGWATEGEGNPLGGGRVKVGAIFFKGIDNFKDENEKEEVLIEIAEDVGKDLGSDRVAVEFVPVK